MSDGQLAAKYFIDREYVKASELYQQLFRQSKASFYFSRYILCLTELEDFTRAEKEIKQEIRNNPGALTLYVEQGKIYKLQNKISRENSSYEKAINKLTPDLNIARSLANAFLIENKPDWSEKVYLKMREIMKINLIFRLELANLYYLQRKHKAMLEEYFLLLEENPDQIINIQRRLHVALRSDIQNSLHDLIQSALLSRIQANPDNINYSELMIWFRVQEKNFADALRLGIALDKRLKEDGRKVFNISGLARSNEDYNTAINGYLYLIEKGKPLPASANEPVHGDPKRPKKVIKKPVINFPVYESSMIELQKTKYSKIFIETYPDKAALENLEKDIQTSLENLGLNINTAILMKKIAIIQGMYLGKSTSAINILESIDKIRGISPIFSDECKIDLADIYLCQGKIWDATLIYAGVESRNENNPTGHTAKFRKSKLAYYAGNFRWAKAQLDALKASTSKLIANDAMSLSLLITDNTGFDSTESAMKMYSRADLLFFQKNDSLSLLTLDSLLSAFPDNSLVDESLFKKAEILEKMKDYQSAADLYKKIYHNYSTDILADNSLFKHALLLENKLQRKDEAMSLYKNLMTTYPGSIFVAEARKRYRYLLNILNPNETG